MPQKTKQETTTKYLITDKQGRELGESTGTSKAQALVRLYLMDPHGPRISLKKAQEEVDEKNVRFKVLA